MPTAPPGRGVTFTRTSAAGRSSRTQAAHTSTPRPRHHRPDPLRARRNRGRFLTPTFARTAWQKTSACLPPARELARPSALGRACTRRGSVPMAVTEVRSIRDDPVGQSKVLVVLRFPPSSPSLTLACYQPRRERAADSLKHWEAFADRPSKRSGYHKTGSDTSRLCPRVGGSGGHT